MTVSADDAVRAARAYADGRGRPAWKTGSVSVRRAELDGRNLWRVAADDEPADGEPDWSFEFDGGQSYLVDAETGECVGVGLLNGDMLFGAAKDA